MEYFDDILTRMNDCNIIISNNNDNYKIESKIDSICDDHHLISILIILMVHYIYMSLPIYIL